jgi:hypothetical protein
MVEFVVFNMKPQFKNPWPPVYPIDEKHYDIELRDGALLKNVEYWAFGGGFDPYRKNESGGHVFFPMDEVVSFQLSE